MKISIIGAGAMGGALAEGLIKGDYIQNEDICVADPSRDSREHFSNLGITATPSNQLAAQGADIVCVVVKPWLVEQVLKGIKDVLDYSSQLLIVVAAGVKSTDINTWLDKGGDTIPTFLVIPNIAIAHLQSMTFIVPDANATQQQTEQVKALFDSMVYIIEYGPRRYGGIPATKSRCSIPSRSSFVYTGFTEIFSGVFQLGVMPFSFCQSAPFLVGIPANISMLLKLFLIVFFF